MAFTLAQARTYLQDYDKSNGSDRSVRIYDKAVNDSLRDLYALGEFDFSTRTTRLAFTTNYSTGTVSVNAGATAVTGSGTTFTSAMAGRYIRFNGENEQYLITAYSSATSITIEAYLGESNLSAVTYVISDERKPLPSLFRSVQRIIISNSGGSRGTLWEVMFRDWASLDLYRKTYQTAERPYYYSVKWEAPTSGNVPVGYCHIYPAPNRAIVATVYYNIWPTLVSSASDELPIPYEAEGVIRELMLAFLMREDGDDWVTQMQRARAQAIEALGATRSVDATRCKQEWLPEKDRLPQYYPQIAPSVLAQMDP